MKRIMPAAYLLIAVAAFIHSAQAKWVWTPQTGWFRAETVPRATPEDSLKTAKDLYDSGQFKKAHVELTRFLRFFPGHELQEEVLPLAANAAFKAGDVWKAHQHVLAYWNNYPRGTHTSQLVELDYMVAVKLIEGNWGRLYGIPLLPGGVTGRGVLEQLLERSPYHPLADDAQLELGNFYLERRNYPEARLAYESLLLRYPQRETCEEARFNLAVATVLDSQGIDYDVALLQDAAGEFQYFAALFPQSDLAPEASLLFRRIVIALGRKDLRVALYYIRTGHRDAAAYYLRSVESRYRGTSVGDAAFALLGAIGSGQSNRRVASLAKRLSREVYDDRETSENFENQLQRLGL